MKVKKGGNLYIKKKEKEKKKKRKKRKKKERKVFGCKRTISTRISIRRYSLERNHDYSYP